MRDPVRFLTLSLLVAGAAPPLAHAQAPVDTVIAVDPGGRLDVENFRGSVTVHAWDRNEVRVMADGPRNAVRIHGGGSSVTVRTEHQHGHRSVDYRLNVPATMDMTIHGVDTDVTSALVKAGDVVIAVPPAALEAGIAVQGCHTVAAGSFKLRTTNASAGAINPASASWTFVVLRR